MCQKNMHVTQRSVSVRIQERVQTEITLLWPDDEMWSWVRSGISILVLLGFSAAFGTINYSILLWTTCRNWKWGASFCGGFHPFWPNPISVNWVQGKLSLLFSGATELNSLSPCLFYFYMKLLGELILQFRILHYEYTDHIQILTMS